MNFIIFGIFIIVITIIILTWKIYGEVICLAAEQFHSFNHLEEKLPSKKLYTLEDKNNVFYKPNNTIKLGLDLHGVIDNNPEFFSNLSKELLEYGHEIYVITGREVNESLIQELKACQMDGLYTDILSITTHQKALGTPISYLDGKKENPIMDPEIWNPTKAALCATAGIHIMIDDSVIYQPFFNEIKTQYILYTDETKELLEFLLFYKKRG